MAQINFIDIETTGFNFKSSDRIVEIAVLGYDSESKQVNDRFSTLVNPKRVIPAAAYNIHGISNYKVDSCKEFKEYVTKVHDSIHGNYICGHNINRFDVPFIFQELLRSGGQLPREGKILDTILIAKKFVKTESYSLDNLCKYFGIDNSNRTLHGALIDCELTLSLFQKLYDEFDITECAIDINDNYIADKKLNYDLSGKYKAPIAMPKYLNATTADENIIREKIKQERVQLPWLDRFIPINGIDVGLNLVPVENKEYSALVMVSNAQYILQSILISEMQKKSILDENKMPTYKSVNDGLIRFRNKLTPDREIIYLVFNMPKILEVLGAKALRELKIKTANDLLGRSTQGDLF